MCIYLSMPDNYYLQDSLHFGSITEEAVAEGSICQRKGCGKGKQDVGDDDNCEHHPGCPIFHEGEFYKVLSSIFNRLAAIKCLS